jgi:Domain of unknown function (DUF5666)
MFMSTRVTSFSFKRLLLAVLSAALIVTGLVASVRTGGTGLAVEYGEIEGFGSIVVNGVHYDERHANIIINSVPNQPPHLLELGMIVEVQGTVDATRTAGVADVVIVNRTLVGQVQAVDGVTGEFTVLNQRVRPSSTVRMVGISHSSQVVPGLWLGIYGLRDAASNVVMATRLEGLDAASSSSIRGSVSNVTSTQFNIGALVVSRAGAAINEAEHLVNGAFVEVAGAFDAVQNVLRATAINVTNEVHGADGADTAITGFVAGFQSLSNFTVAGVTVDASGARFTNGTATDLVDGRKVEAEGHFMGGVLHAEVIEFKNTVTATPASTAQRTIEIEGRISSYRSPTDFTLKGYAVDASRARVKLPHGLVIGAGTRAHVKGAIADGVVRATSIEYEK